MGLIPRTRLMGSWLRLNCNAIRVTFPSYAICNMIHTLIRICARQRAGPEELSFLHYQVRDTCHDNKDNSGSVLEAESNLQQDHLFMDGI